jgi:hypothetical protein
MFKQVPLNPYVEKQKHSFTWRWVGLILLFFVCTSAFAQNTKGDKPIRPLPRITQKSKPAKGKKVKSNTRDISGRRLRTKNKSTAGRAVISASSPYKGRPSRSGDRPARPIRGVPTRVRSSSAQSARNNVYPNKGPYINNPSRKPRKSERSFSNAGPIGNPRVLGRSKAASIPKKSRVAPLSASRSFLSRGKKNVYWGKFSKGEKAYAKDITGRPLRTKNFRSPKPEIIPQTDPFYGRGKRGDKTQGGQVFPGFISASKRGERAWRGDISKKAIKKNSSKNRIENAGQKFLARKLSVSGKRSNKSLPGNGNQSRSGKGRNNRPLAAKIPVSGAGIGNYQGNMKRSKVSPFSSQGSAFSGNRKKARGARGGGSVSGDPRDNSGRPIGVRIPGGGANMGAYQGAMKGRRPEKGGGSISGRARNNKGISIGAKIPPAEAARAGTFQGRTKRWDLTPSFGRQGIGYSGSIKTRRAEKGGGSISGRSRNNKGNAIATRIPTAGAARAGTYSGNLKSSTVFNYRDQGEEFSGFSKTRRPIKGGGSISGRSRNNNGNAIAVRIPTTGAARAGTYSGNLKSSRVFNYNDQGEEFTGFMKARKPLKGGGSISGRSRNNKGNAIAVRIPTSGAAKAGTYSGNLKASQIFNYRDQGEEFTGFIKGRKPVKGGGSISGKLWNNKEKPIDVRTPLSSDAKAANYSGKIKQKEDYVQNEKASKLSLKKKEPKKGAYEVEGLQVKVKQHDFAQNPRSARSSNKKREPEKGADAVEGLQIKVKQDDYIQNRLASKSSIKKREPEKGAFAAEGLQIKVRREKYQKNPNAKPGALRAISPNSATVKASEYVGRMKVIWDYKHNPSSSKSALDVVRPNRAFAKGNEYQGRTRLTKNYRHNPKSSNDALKVIAPGKAYAKISNYQGNLKMSKPHGSNLHPDAKFAHGHINNVKKERTILTNAKLWWSRLFKKSDTQPSAVKEKVKRPRYDKKERELWKDLYD